MTKKEIAVVRRKIKAEFPNLKFKIRKVSFSGFGYGESYFLDSDEWGMTKVGSHNLFNRIEELVKGTGIIVSW